MDERRIKHIKLVLFITWTSAFCIFTGVRAQSGSFVDYHIHEGLPPGTIIGNVVDDAELNKRYSPSEIQQMTFTFLDQPDSETPLFSISQKSGQLQTIQKIDRDILCPQESECHVFLDVAVGPAEYFQVINLRVSIEDINDNKPVFPQSSISLRISEAALPGTSYSLPAATDPDSEKFSIHVYELKADTDKFSLTESKGLDGSVDLQLVLQKRLDREQVGNYQVTVLAHDGGTPSKQGSLLINITVADANDNEPVFTNKTFEASIPEDTPVNRTVTRVTAFDNDQGVNSQIVYGFSRRTESSFGDLFGIRPNTGEIYLKKALDYEEAKIYHLGVTARDSGPDSQVARAPVVVHVLDVNDNAPQITVNTLTYTGDAQIPEGSPISTFVAHISAGDRDGGRNGMLSCVLHSENFFLQHMYDSKYTIVTTTVLDREVRSRYDITITCQDLGTPTKITTKDIQVTVLDENDHSPVFTKQLYQVSIDENNEKNALITEVKATDEDVGRNGQILYSLQGEGAHLFYIHPSHGTIKALQSFDHEEQREIRLQVKASDQGQPPRTDTAMVRVTINDQNDEAPYFIDPRYSFQVPENKPPGQVVGNVAAGDPDTGQYSKVEFTLRGHTNKFQIDPYSGEITTRQTLDRETQGVYEVTVVASNPGYGDLSSSVTATINVGDENDNSPEILFPDQLNNTVHVSNKARLGTVFTRVIATDADIGENAKLVYNIAAEGDREGLFDIDPKRGALTVNKDLSNLLNSLITLELLVSDMGDPVHMTYATIHIVVNKSLAGDLPEASRSSGFLCGANRTIVISLATASAVVVLALCVAIVIIKSYDRKDRTREPLEHKTEAQSMLPPPGEKDSSEGGHSFHTISRDSTAEKSVHKKEVTFTDESLYPLDHRGSPNKIANSTQSRDTSLHQVPNQVGNRSPLSLNWKISSSSGKFHLFYFFETWILFSQAKAECPCNFCHTWFATTILFQTVQQVSWVLFVCNW